MANVIAGRKYKIVNTLTQNSLHVVAGSSNGASVSTTPWKGVANQVWKATKRSDGGLQFEVDNQPTPNTTYVLDASQTALGETCVYANRGSSNQVWTIEPIKPQSFLCYVKSSTDGRCLQFDAENKKARVVAKDSASPAQFWTFEE